MKCKHCKETFEPVKFLQKYCFKDECVRVFVEEAKVKTWKKTKAKMKDDLMTLQDYLKISSTNIQQVHKTKGQRQRMYKLPKTT
jgi:hypothetical protein